MTLFQLVCVLNVLHILRAELSTYSTNEIWSISGITYRRPVWSQNVTIQYDNSQIWSVEGIVLPISTSGRPNAPNPYNDATTGTAVNLDKGHLMALSNGGCDISLNIVPQSSQWQRTGGWRDMEVIVFQHAMSKYGWNQSSIYHASQIEQVDNVGGYNYIIYNITIIAYNLSSGQPIEYKGTIQSGTTDIYSFTITPNNDPIWDQHGVPPDNATFIEPTTTAPTSSGIMHQINFIMVVLSAITLFI